MLAEILPNEVLFYIFENLNDKDLLRCSKVCQRWRDAVDCLPDGFWRRFCDQNYWCTRTEMEKTNLPKNFKSLCPLYRDLYASLTLWPQIEAAALHLNRFPSRDISHYKILNNTTLTILPDTDETYSNAVIYYDLETLEERDRQTFNFLFHTYDENDAMISVVDKQGHLCVMSKENKKCYQAGTLYGADMVEYGEYKLLDDNIYFTDDHKGILHACKLNNLNDELNVTKADKRAFWVPKIVAFTDYHEGNIFFLDTDGMIYKCETKVGRVDAIIRICLSLEDYGLRSLDALRRYGFDWSFPVLYNWLKENLPQSISRITNIDVQTICRHGHIVVLGTEHTIHVFVNPYDDEGMLILNSKAPDRSIDIQKLYNGTESLKIYVKMKIRKLDVIEMLNGHRIIFLYGDELLFLDFLHKDLLNADLPN